MEKRKVYYVSPTADMEWKVKGRGAERAVKIFEGKAEAIELAKELAKGAGLGQVLIQNQKGKIQTEYTYGKDPEKYAG